MDLRSALVGREAERETLSQAIERARRGSGSLLLLSGEAGVGKTRLAEGGAAGSAGGGLRGAGGRRKAAPRGGGGRRLGGRGSARRGEQQRSRSLRPARRAAALLPAG